MIALLATVPAAAQDRSSLPIPQAPFAGQVAETVSQSRPDPVVPVTAPAGAPNVFVMLSDDVGFAMSSTFGGPVPTPNFDRIAGQGQRYNRFHTTGICSPTRAALLTGRNHHNAGAGYLTDSTSDFPGYQGRISDETASLAQILRLNGYNTAMFGKHHNVVAQEQSINGPFDRWPTGLGFEYFFGYVGPESDQYRTNLYRGTNLLPNDGTMQLLDSRLADDAINWLHNQQAMGAGKPFFVYFAPSSTHEPHQAPADYIARFKGKFDKGWDVQRVETWRRQLAMGIIPAGTKLTPRPEAIPAWDSLTPQQRTIYARSMEAAAGELVYQDEQIGRVLAEMDRMGVLDNTLVALMIGDNGAAADQGVAGTFNSANYTNRFPEDDQWRLDHIDKLGGPASYPNYQGGWAWAMNTPLRWTKQYASMLGGIRNGMILSWKGHVAKPGAVCSQFGHVVDIAPTVLDAAKVPAPASVYGVKQKPMDGQSLLGSLAACDPRKPRTQYFEIGGKLGLWQDGWFASNDDGRLPWEGVGKNGRDAPGAWTLYDLNQDFSQSTDVSAKYPERLQAMVSAWHKEAERNQVFPLDHSFALGRANLSAGKSGTSAPNHFTFWGKNISIPAFRGPNFIGRSFTVNATLDLPSDNASGVILANGSMFAGWTFYLDHGKPTFVYARTNVENQITRIAATGALPKGKSEVRLTYKTQGIGKPADVSLSVGSNVIASGNLPATFFVVGPPGEMLDTGQDTGVPVTQYATPLGSLEGAIERIDLDLK